MNNGGASRSTPSTSSANSRLKKTTNKSGLTPVRFTDSSPGNALKLKSGLTPVRPDRPVYNPSKSPFRSPGSGLKLKSGLTPIRPELSHIQSKSPFNRQGLQPKLKSGLLPIKPQSSNQNQPSKFSCALDSNSGFANRRKSGLLPMKTGSLVNTSIYEASFSTSRNNPGQQSNSRISIIAPSTAASRKSWVPSSKTGLGLAPPKNPPWNKATVSSIGSGRTSLNPNSLSVRPARKKDGPPSLKMINEDGESPGNRGKSNLSGVDLLDETVDGTVVHKLPPRRPNSNDSSSQLSSASTRSSSANLTKTRIPKRVLHFPDDDDLTENIPLKDSSSRMNVLDPPESREEIVARLQRRKKELEEVTRAAALELEGIDKQLCLLRLDEGVQTTAMDNLSLERDTGSETGSPFANVGSSPTAAAPLELLSRDFAKRPENIYKVFRQSCSFLKTPQPSAFRKDTSLQRFQQTSQYSGDETPNISRRLQKQLADLFDE